MRGEDAVGRFAGTSRIGLAISVDGVDFTLDNGTNGGGDLGDPSLPRGAYAPGQALFDPVDPTACIARAVEPFLRPDSEGEAHGQVDNVCFAQGLVLFEGSWRLYFGMADSRIGCAVGPARLS